MGLSECNTQVDTTGRELAEHGKAAFPVACYYDDLVRDPVPWHWHDEFEAVVVAEGETVVAIDSERYRIKKGGGFFVNSGVLHSCWSADASECRYYSTVFHPRLVGGSMDSVFWLNYLQPVLENTSLKSLILTPDIPWHREILEAIEAAWRSCIREAPGYEFEVRGLLSRILFHVADHAGAAAGTIPQRALRDENRIKEMLQFVHAHYAEEITLEQIAGSASISGSECLRCFRSTIGTTPVQYLKSYRLRCAAELLSQTEEKIVDVGVQCGFQDMSYFAKTFRRAYGSTPSEFRRKQTAERATVQNPREKQTAERATVQRPREKQAAERATVQNPWEERAAGRGAGALQQKARRTI